MYLQEGISKMNKFGCKENFDIEIHVEGIEEPFLLDSVNKFHVVSENDDQYNRFHIHDSLIDVSFINAVLGGALANKFCKLVCKSKFRDTNGVDVPVEMTVKGAVLVNYKFDGTAYLPSQPNIVFESDFFDRKLQSNTSLVVKE